MNLRSRSAWASLSLLPSPYTRMSSAIHIIALEPSSADVSLMWNSSGALVIPNGRPNNLYLPCDVCMVVILEDSSSRGIWRKPLISTRGNHFAELSLWSCSFRVGIECFGRWMALFGLDRCILGISQTMENVNNIWVFELSAVCLLNTGWLLSHWKHKGEHDRVGPYILVWQSHNHNSR